MTPSYVSLKVMQLLSETFFFKSKIKNYLEWVIKMGYPVYYIEKYTKLTASYGSS